MITNFLRFVMKMYRRNFRKVAVFILISGMLLIGAYYKAIDNSTLSTRVKLTITKDVFEPLVSSRYRVRFDVSQKYIITEFAIVGDNWKNMPHNPPYPFPCLATQGSVTYLRHLLPLSRRWQGLVSVAVLVPGIDFPLAVLQIENMRHCYPDLMANVAIHLVYMTDYPPDFSMANDMLLDINDCRDSNLDLVNRTRFDYSKILYPQNLLRNIASNTCTTSQVLVSDIDMIPSLGLAPKLGAFFANESHCSKCVFVIPAYEVQRDATIPNNKAELMALVQKNQSRPYRQKAFDLNQGATNSKLWQQLPNGDDVTIGYRLKCFKFFYEPFYLREGPVPPFDERFQGYGFTRNTQVYETQLAGFRFFVLNNVFLIQHEMVDNPYASPGRAKQVKSNTKLYKKLEKEFAVKYKNINQLPCASSN